jgi:prevent-host-death family protein
MRSSEFSNLIDRALAGEPQRATRHGKEAVVIVSEADWPARPESSPTPADLFLKTIGEAELVDAIVDRSWGVPLAQTLLIECRCICSTRESSRRLVIDAYFEATMTSNRHQNSRM